MENGIKNIYFHKQKAKSIFFHNRLLGWISRLFNSKIDNFNSILHKLLKYADKLLQLPLFKNVIRDLLGQNIGENRKYEKTVHTR